MTLTYLIAAVILLLLNGFFVAGEFAMIASRRTKIEGMAATGDFRSKLALKSIRELSIMLAGAQLGITIASLALGYVAEPAVAHLIEAGLHDVSVPEEAAHTIAFVIALSIVSFFHLVIGEIAPKNIAISDPEKAALWLVIPFRLFTNLFRPLLWILNKAANGLLRMVGVEPQDEIHTAHSAREIGRMIDESAQGGMLKDHQHRLLEGALSLSDRDVASVMKPRTEMLAVPLTATPAEVEGLVTQTGYSRFPVFSEHIDRVLGFVHSKDLLSVPNEARHTRLPRRLIRPLLVVPETKKLHPLLYDMKRERKHFALVVDEHGGTSGVVSLEDLLEELVGDILDEHDLNPAEVQRVGPGRFVVSGTLPLEDLSKNVDLDIPEGEYDTLAGFLMERLGRIPRRRDEVRHGRWTMRVLSMHRRRVVQVLLEDQGPRSGD